MEPKRIREIEVEKDAKIHYLKSWPEVFQAHWEGKKSFEIRVNDREFESGDYAVLQEYVPKETGLYTGREILGVIGYITQARFGLPNNICVFQLEVRKFYLNHAAGSRDYQTFDRVMKSEEEKP